MNLFIKLYFRSTGPCIVCLPWVKNVEINPMLFLLLASPETLRFEWLSECHQICQLDSKNVIQSSLQASRCWGFCKTNSFIMLMPLFCHTYHFHLSRVEKSSDGFGFFNERCLTFSEMRNMKKHVSMASGIWQSQQVCLLNVQEIRI